MTHRCCGLLVVLLGACAGPAKSIHPDDMGAEAHRKAARREQAAATEHFACWDEASKKPTTAAVPAGQDTYLDSTFWFDSRGWELAEAERHVARARAHDAAADRLEAFEAEQCLGIPPDGREACYLLGPVTDVRDIEGGVFLLFAEEVDTRAVAAHLRCHYAWARKQGWDRDGGCAFDVAGVRFQVAGPAILVLSQDPATIRELRRRARLQVQVAPAR